MHIDIIEADFLNDYLRPYRNLITSYDSFDPLIALYIADLYREPPNTVYIDMAIERARASLLIAQ